MNALHYDPFNNSFVNSGSFNGFIKTAIKIIIHFSCWMNFIFFKKFFDDNSFYLELDFTKELQ